MIKIKRAIRNALIALSAVFLSACAQEGANQATLVALGDSITYGANLEDSGRSAYPYLIGNDAGFEVHNLAISGWQTAQVKEALREDEEYRQKVKDADVIAMTIGANDLLEILRLAESASAGDPERMEEIMRQELSNGIVFSEIGKLIEEIQSLTDAQILLYNIYNPFPPHSNMHQIGETLLPEVNAAFREVAESYENVYLADAYSAFRNKQEDYIIAGDIHPTEEGQAVLAEIGLEVIETE
ncbi:GDSL-type esterase/lipase family protein [Planococcus shenhongbingii]|uniref:GDSL-type esterase/lipase family protein n=1 Tax=Planococcus shenhongbingii TaxID=3058398 RepID=A0ABT8NGR6_9BACL|nr:GDSL-type esterase/lipase family protein [Planococcus sp. N017]MDN7247074.1 GDSL-type esterase/lipase family protein [Planococcus sp. N017]